MILIEHWLNADWMSNRTRCGKEEMVLRTDPAVELVAELMVELMTELIVEIAVDVELCAIPWSVILEMLIFKIVSSNPLIFALVLGARDSALLISCYFYVSFSCHCSVFVRLSLVIKQEENPVDFWSDILFIFLRYFFVPPMGLIAFDCVRFGISCDIDLKPRSMPWIFCYFATNITVSATVRNRYFMYSDHCIPDQFVFCVPLFRCTPPPPPTVSSIPCPFVVQFVVVTFCVVQKYAFCALLLV